MSKKGFITLTGDSKAKNLLQEILKVDYWTWNPSPIKRAWDISTSLGWDTETKEGRPLEFIGKLLSLSDEYYDFQYGYVKSFIDKILKSEKASENNKKADVLIVHGIKKELRKRLQDDFDFWEVHVLNEGEEIVDNFENGKFVIIANENFQSNLEKVMDIICFEVKK